MRTRRGDGRILIYSHDTFGLGHLRRCRTIAHSLVERFKQLSVLILSGLADHRQLRFPRARRFRARARRDQAAQRRIHVAQPAHRHRARRWRCAPRSSGTPPRSFGPDLFIVDKEPLGLRGEVHETLKMLKRSGTRLVLGLRDVMDEPRLLEPEWQRKNAMPGAARPVRRDLGLRPAADLRSAGRHRAAGARARRRWSTPAICTARCRRTARRRACPRSPTGRICWSPPAAAATARG